MRVRDGAERRAHRRVGECTRLRRRRRYHRRPRGPRRPHRHRRRGSDVRARVRPLHA